METDPEEGEIRERDEVLRGGEADIEELKDSPAQKGAQDSLKRNYRTGKALTQRKENEKKWIKSQSLMLRAARVLLHRLGGDGAGEERNIKSKAKVNLFQRITRKPGRLQVPNN
jgi:hypothetical protein